MVRVGDKPLVIFYDFVYLQGGGGDDMDMEDQSSSVSQETPSPSTTPDHRLHTPPPELQLETDLHVPLTSPSKWNVST